MRKVRDTEEIGSSIADTDLCKLGFVPWSALSRVNCTGKSEQCVLYAVLHCTQGQFSKAGTEKRQGQLFVSRVISDHPI